MIRTPWKIIYGFQCGEFVCDKEYIWETSRTFAERFKEHIKKPSPIHNHSNTTCCTTSQDNFLIIGMEDHGIAISIKESIYIWVNNPTLNGNIGKLNLPHIWDRVLFNTLGLKVNGHVQGIPSIGHAQSTLSIMPIHRMLGHMEHAQRTPVSEHANRTFKHI